MTDEGKRAEKICKRCKREKCTDWPHAHAGSRVEKCHGGCSRRENPEAENLGEGRRWCIAAACPNLAKKERLVCGEHDFPATDGEMEGGWEEKFSEKLDIVAGKNDSSHAAYQDAKDEALAFVRNLLLEDRRETLREVEEGVPMADCLFLENTSHFENNLKIMKDQHWNECRSAVLKVIRGRIG